MSANLIFPKLSLATEEEMQTLLEGLWDDETILPKKFLAMLDMLRDDNLYPVSRYEHSLQTATRAYRDGADEEMVVVALLHDIGEVYSVRNHAAVSAEILKPYISADNYWLLIHHQIFQGHYYFDKIGLDKNMRDKFKDHPMYEKTVYFCEHWDEVSFEKGYDTLPITVFEPMIENVMKRKMQRRVNFSFQPAATVEE